MLGGCYFVVVAVLLLKIWEEDGVGVRGGADNDDKYFWQWCWR